MPFLLLGITPGILGIVYGDFQLLFFAMIQTTGCVMDLKAVYSAIKNRELGLFQDHPTLMGYQIINHNTYSNN
ncbi:MAG: hypothetical protein KAH13_02485 [Tenericutes bacterium]|nr:hypothetical protein [Mycoplasmatota bacterium]